MGTFEYSGTHARYSYNFPFDVRLHGRGWCDRDTLALVYRTNRDSASEKRRSSYILYEWESDRVALARGGSTEMGNACSHILE